MSGLCLKQKYKISAIICGFVCLSCGLVSAPSLIPPRVLIHLKKDIGGAHRPALRKSRVSVAALHGCDEGQVQSSAKLKSHVYCLYFFKLAQWLLKYHRLFLSEDDIQNLFLCLDYGVVYAPLLISPSARS